MSKPGSGIPSVPQGRVPAPNDFAPKEAIRPNVQRNETGMFRIALSTTDDHEVGWLGWDNDRWAIVVKNLNDALLLQRYVWKGKTYYCVGADVNGPQWKWLSVEKNSRVCFWDWNGATSWTWESRQLLKSDYDGGYLSVDSQDMTNLKTAGKLLKVSEEPAYAGPIRHVFVLMMENRSFDHMLGFSEITGKDAESKQARSVNGLKGKESNRYGDRTFPVTRGADWSMPADPGHEFRNVLKQLCGTTDGYRPGAAYPAINNTGYVADYAAVEGVKDPAELMKCYDPGQIPALVTLAREFAVCDNWFASLPGPTWPNRYFAFAGSSGGLDDSPTERQLIRWSTVSGFTFANGTLFDANALDWDIYVDQIEGSNCASVAGISHFTDLKLFSSLANNLKKGQAAQFTFIEPNYGNFAYDYKGGNSQHPLDDVRSGDRFIASVYSAIRNSPIWEHSMLIITYDEHGGFYDHVTPPAAKPPGDKQVMEDVNTQGFTFNQYGVRVPAVIVSPLVEKGVIDGRLYDHASIPATVEALFRLAPLTERDKAARSLHSLITLQEPRKDCPTSIPYPRVADLDRTFPAAREFVLTAAQRESKREQPIDSIGNLPGFVYSAMRLHIELEPEQATAIKARVQSLKTVGDAEDYIEEVKELLVTRAMKPAA
jgi:phospholipase C